MATDTLELNCWVFGDHQSRVFAVTVSRSNNVMFFRALIKKQKEPEFNDIAADELDLWKLDVPIKNLMNAAPEAVKKENLEPFAKIVEIFREGYVENNVHVIVKRPSKEESGSEHEQEDEITDLITKFQITLKNGLDAPAPSTLMDIHNLSNPEYKFNVDYLTGRPIERFGLPVGLYHPVFNKFAQGLTSQTEAAGDFSSEFFDNISTLCVVASDFYSKESDRSTALRPALNSLLKFVLARSFNPDGTSTDGTIDVTDGGNVLGILCIEEEKNKIGLGGCDPSLQAGRSYLKRWSQELYIRVRNACPCPSFCIGIAGPWICVLGAVLTDNVIVQPLTDYIWLGGDHYDFTKLYSIARLFRSLASGLKDLDKYYRSLSRADAPLTERMFPYIRSFLCKGQEVAFSYIKPLSGRKPIFLAQLDDKTKVVVKFVHSYSSVAHRLVANEGLAPCLLYCGMDDASAPFFGRLKMVVMGYIEGVSAHYIMQKMRLNQRVYESVRRAVDILHNSNFVFGDLRPANIMIDAEGTAWLVDFDWCSIEGQGRYPPIFNMSAADWHGNVGRGGVMMKAHDIYLLDAFRAMCM